MLFNIPTLLTLFRIILIPFFLLIFYLPLSWSPFICALLFVIAAITDWFDGFLARRWKQITRFGTFLDPVADKVIVTTALVLITQYYHTWYITLPAAIMIAREIIVSALREWMAEIGKRTSIAVSWIGKIKTFTQMLALFLLLWHVNIYTVVIGVLALYTATILTFWSMFKYLNASHNSLIET